MKAPTADIPLEHQALYDVLGGVLAAFDASSAGGVPTEQPVWAGALVTASSNNGRGLLARGSLKQNKDYLNALQNVGFGATSLELSYPLLVPGFDDNRAADYLAFYKAIIAEARRRDMAVFIECTAIFPDYSSLPVDDWYAGLTVERYAAEKAAMLKLIVDELAPDCLSLGNEPDTEAANTGLPINNPAVYQQLINYYLQTIGATDILLGAGIGSWIDDHTTWVATLCDTALDFINLHLYPIDAGLLERASDILKQAHALGKRTAIHEAWLYKWRHGDPGGMGTSAYIYSLDTYEHWAPLDALFLAATYALGRNYGALYVSPFWSNLFFASLTWEEGRDMEAHARLNLAVRRGVQAAIQGRLSETGIWMRNQLAARRLPLGLK